MVARVFCISFLLALIPAASSIAQQDYSVTVSNVIVWVKALDSSGKPVQNLKAEDFEIYENDKQAPVDCFEESNMPAPADENAQNAQSPAIKPESPTTRARQKFVVFLDLYNTPSTDYLYLKPRLQQFFDQIQGGGYETMITAFTPQGKLGVVTRYTQDTAKLKAILDQAKGNPGIDQEVQANERQIVSLLEKLTPEETPTDSIDDLTTVSPTREMNNQLLKGSIALARGFAQQERNRSEFSVKALEALGAFLSKENANDHTVVIYVSGGFNSQPGRRYFELIDRVAEGRGFKSDNFIFALRTGGSPTPEKFDLYPLLQKTIGKLSRYNVTLYTLNTRGIAAASSNTSMSNEFEIQEAQYLPDLQQPLQQIADETGGLFFQNSRNFKFGLDKILNDLQHQYILCYKPPEAPANVDYFRIKVVCKKPGVELRYRKGYAK